MVLNLDPQYIFSKLTTIARHICVVPLASLECNVAVQLLLWRPAFFSVSCRICFFNFSIWVSAFVALSSAKRISSCIPITSRNSLLVLFGEGDLSPHLLDSFCYLRQRLVGLHRDCWCFSPFSLLVPPSRSFRPYLFGGTTFYRLLWHHARTEAKKALILLFFFFCRSRLFDSLFIL